jgi:hypothetical protein
MIVNRILREEHAHGDIELRRGTLILDPEATAPERAKTQQRLPLL